MYIKYRSLLSGNPTIVNIDVSNCNSISVLGNKLFINMPKASKDATVSFSLKSEEDAYRALSKLFDTLKNKSPLGNILDLINLDEIVASGEEGGD